jgi:hypothetical protein
MIRIEGALVAEAGQVGPESNFPARCQHVAAAVPQP